MSLTVKKAATVLSMSVIATVLTVACATAQGGPGGLSGGNRLRQSTEEGRGSLGTVGLLSRQFSLPVAWQGAFGSYFASQYANTFIARTSSVSVVTRRTIAKR